MNLEQELRERVDFFEEALTRYLPAEVGESKTVLEAMNYSVRAGGKRLRPVMLIEVCRIFGKGTMKALPFAVALEMIHTYSLVHDDLPAMDNDELRRGMPTTHKKYGVAMGILAGDGLLNLAYEIMADAMVSIPDRDMRGAVRAYSIIAHAAGVFGMVGGQCADVESEKNGVPMTSARLDYTYHNKTGALLAAALGAGAALADAPGEHIEALRKAGYALGDAFQIRDDILDEIGNENILGKPIGSDEKNEKTTYVSLYGMDAAKEKVKVRTDEAIAYIKDLPVETEFLLELFHSLVAREK